MDMHLAASAARCRDRAPDAAADAARARPVAVLKAMPVTWCAGPAEDSRRRLRQLKAAQVGGMVCGTLKCATVRLPSSARRGNAARRSDSSVLSAVAPGAPEAAGHSALAAQRPSRLLAVPVLGTVTH